MKLSLGTATFGQSYGFFNKDNTLKSNECINILESAKEIGITSLDTAQSYGTSESILGSCPFLQSSFRVSSKVDTSNLCDIDIHSALLASLLSSLHRLGISSLDTLYIHSYPSSARFIR